jgi:hypothetical protein
VSLCILLSIFFYTARLGLKLGDLLAVCTRQRIPKFQRQPSLVSTQRARGAKLEFQPRDFAVLKLQWRPNHGSIFPDCRNELKLGDLLAVYLRQRIPKFQRQPSLVSTQRARGAKLEFQPRDFAVLKLQWRPNHGSIMS